MEMKVKRREWVKTAAIIFLAVLLVLTFFSNTIMNYSLPEVATQSAQSGTINAKIRGTGTVAANESYEVTVEQSHKVASVLVKEGQEVKVDDVLFRFEGGESDELKTAQDALDQAEQSYEKSLIEAGNAAAKENREIQKARDAYNEALAVYQQYSSMSSAQLAKEQAAADAKLQDLQREKSELDTELSALESDTDYKDAQAEVTSATADINSLNSEIEALRKQLANVGNMRSAAEIRQDISDLQSRNAENLATYDNDFQAFSKLCDGEEYLMEACKNDPDALKRRIQNASQTELTDEALTNTANNYIAAYNALYAYYFGSPNITELEAELKLAIENDSNKDNNVSINQRIGEKESKLYDAERRLSRAKRTVSDYQDSIAALKSDIQDLTFAVTDQQSAVDKLTKASTAAATMKSAKDTLENLVFEQNLADSASVDIKAAKESIEKQRKNVEKLQKESAGSEVKSPVNGTISSLAISAGQTANAGTTLAKIDVTDRGYTLKIPVTNEQAKKVTIGEKAELVNYWWGGDDISATLESVGTDPAKPTSGKQLTFRLDGAVEPGQSITLSIGQKSANYDCLVPNSAVRSDNNGSFVLLVTSKSSPLGNRYTATRVSVNVLASDDTSTAVTGLSAGDFVLTTSSKPVSSGMQVRLADES